MKIDLVITYVDNTNVDWQKNYASSTENSYPMYFRTSPDALKYLLRSVDKNLPFINQVFLVVQNASEVPGYVDTNIVHVVTHEQFIPAEYLPTFNSNTIETFLYAIPGLSEHFIYMNDDWLILKELQQSDFYTQDDKAIAYFYCRKFEDGIPTGFDEILMRNNELIWGIDRAKALSRGYTMCMNHTIRPYIKSLYKECYTKHWDKIASTLTTFRSADNYNLYIVDAYQNKVSRGINKLTVTVTGIKNYATDDEITAALSLNTDTISVHDVVEDGNISDNTIMKDFLDNKFDKKSKYEKEVAD